MKKITDRFIDDIVFLNQQKIPDYVLHHARRCLIDYVGSAYAGYPLVKDQIHSLIVNLEPSQGMLPVLGCDIKTNLMTSALVNGIISHAAELDDGVISGIVHPGTPVLSALLPFAVHHNVDGADLLRGIVLGYEVTVRLAQAIQPSHKLLGYHATATCGSVGAALGIMMMMNAPTTKTKSALSVAAVSAGGSLKVLEGESQLKPYNSGQAASSAIIAVSMAEAGFKGPDDVLSGKDGFLEMMSDIYFVDKLFSASRENRFAIEDVYFKPYAACRYCHSPIDAALSIIEKNRIDPKEICQIYVNTYGLAVTGHNHTHIKNVSSAKMSIPFSVAQAIVIGDVGPSGYTDDSIMEPSVLQLTKKITVSPNDYFTSIFPEKTPAEVQIEMDDGKVFKEIIFYPKGEPQRPLTDEEVINKFQSLAEFAVQDKAKYTQLLKAIWSLPSGATGLYKLF